MSIKENTKIFYATLNKSNFVIYKLKSTLYMHIQIHNSIQQTHDYNFKLHTDICK